MKIKKLELEVDFIGGDKPLTAKEEKELSEYFKNTKLIARKSILQVPKKRKSLTKD